MRRCLKLKSLPKSKLPLYPRCTWVVPLYSIFRNRTNCSPARMSGFGELVNLKELNLEYCKKLKLLSGITPPLSL